MPAEERALTSGALSKTVRIRGIGDEPRNARQDQEPSEEALLQGEGGARLPLLSALRQDLSRGHSSPRLCAGPRQCGSAGGGRDELCRDRSGGPGRLAGGLARGPRLEAGPARSGAGGGGARG